MHISCTGFQDKNSLAALLEEALRMKNLDHPNLIKLIGICVDKNHSAPYIVMPYMVNGSLSTHLIRERKSLVLAKDSPQELVSYITYFYNRMDVINYVIFPSENVFNLFIQLLFLHPILEF